MPVPQPAVPEGAAEFPSMVWTSFDRYARYGAIARAVRATLGPGRHHVLDVGDCAGHLQTFDPELDVIGVDLHPAEGRLPGAVPVHADGTALPFPDDTFEAVVTSDVLEHVPPSARPAFLDELQRVSRGLVVVAAPFATAGVVGAEELARRYAMLALGGPQPQLEEHHDNGLPDLSATVAVLASDGVEVLTVGNGNLWDWLTLMLLRFQLEARPALGPLVDSYDTFYNTTLAERSEIGPFYRHLVIARSGGSPETGRPASDPVLEPAPAALLTTFLVADSTEVSRQDTVPKLDGLAVELSDARAELRAVHAELRETNQQLTWLHHQLGSLPHPLYARMLREMPRTRRRLVQVRAAAKALLRG